VALTEERLRCFVALEIGEPMRARIAALTGELRERAPGVRWVRPEGVHLTLRFLGSTTTRQVDALRPVLARLARECAPAEAHVRDLGVFPERGRPRVLWLGLTVPESVMALQAECERAARAAGFAPETRPFRAHLTLGRWRDDEPSMRRSRPGPSPAGADWPAGDLGPTWLDTLVLFRSRPGPGGSVYTPLASFELGEPRPPEVA
jgi:2'-5' RNA ligase